MEFENIDQKLEKLKKRKGVIEMEILDVEERFAVNEDEKKMNKIILETLQERLEVIDDEIKYLEHERK